MVKDNRIELYRFLFMIVIMLNHVTTIGDGLESPILLGHVFVEFYFFLTGFFTYSHIKKKLQCDPVGIDEKLYPFSYTFRKICTLIPYIIMTGIMYYFASALGRCFVQGDSFKRVISDFSGAPFDILLLQITGINNNSYFAAWWYLSTILFVLPLVFILFYRAIIHAGVYYWGMYYLPLMIYGAFAMLIDGLAWRNLAGIAESGFFRGFAGLCIGGVIYDLSQKLSKKECKLTDRVILTCVEAGSFFLSICIAWRGNGANSTFMVVLLLFVGLTISFSNLSYTNIFQAKFCGMLGMVSAPLYICHFSVGRIVGMYSNYCGIGICERYFIYFTMSILTAVIMITVNRKLQEQKYHSVDE